MNANFLEEFDFFTGVPDSLLKPFSDYLLDTCRMGENHIIAANEGNAIGLAAGYHLATGKVPVVYMQNSGLGNAINPLASLMNNQVYGIPCILVIGWRGEPGVNDEPQHIFQGKCTLALLEAMEIPYMIIDDTTSMDEVNRRKKDWKPCLLSGKQVAFVVKKGALSYHSKKKETKKKVFLREEIIQEILNTSGDERIVSTTGKTSRELFELREQRKESHTKDFLTVGSMGHSSSIALEIALQNKDKRVWCIDGDGSCLMHMGAMAVIGAMKPENLVHIVVNNAAHESVGGMPTVGNKIDLPGIAKACGYIDVFSVKNKKELRDILDHIREKKTFTFIEVKCDAGSRDNLGRPTIATVENKKAFMEEVCVNLLHTAQ